ncbi:D-proline reductase (dithiol) PrdA [Spiroplasma chinense]|uniref:D-proline reductase (Dithiol) PrdA n=1 Tax=Spiroplasma chinense TaxID=216932 RepID=A0A5B9Y2W0_9MOLU|nr:D-proline reductase (dithiol) proprotein PrdA [Spiroplasma chinense]QEH61398.1 D-proline reductase (dithiol) PrdA [Spiroplasma chinense]
MSLSKEKIEKIKDKVAFTCCRFEAGKTIDESVLEDPALLPDFVDSGLIVVPDNVLKVREVIGAKLKVTVDALTPLTTDNVENIVSSSEPEKVEENVASVNQQVETQQVAFQTQPQMVTSAVQSNGMVNINIGKGENISISFPAGGGVSTPQPIYNEPITVEGKTSPTASQTVEQETVIRELKKEYIKVDKVELGTNTKLENGVLTLNKSLAKKAIARGNGIVKKFEYEVITEKDYGKVIDTIMDIQPIATKVEGELGQGVTRVLDKVVIMLTGIDGNKKQIGEFGSSEGEIDRNVMWGRPGAPDKGDIFIRCHVVIEANAGMERPGPLAAHMAADVIAQEIRDELKKATSVTVAKTEEFKHTRRPGKPKVCVLKEIMGQGAMHDNLILPVDPVGTVGAVPNVDLGNLPIAISPLELLDGGVHALTCIGPASKETSRHYFREPLVIRALSDPEIDFVGLVLVGSPQVNNEKFYVSKRVGMLFEYIKPDGVIITTEGFGNNHIDFAEHHRMIGQRDIKVVGMTYSAQQGGLVVGNEYMYAMVDLNKAQQGIENEILSNNTLSPEDAIRAVEMLKSIMAGNEIEEAERRWDPSVKLKNVKTIEDALGEKIVLELNEQSLEKSKKRREIYEKE